LAPDGRLERDDLKTNGSIRDLVGRVAVGAQAVGGAMLDQGEDCRLPVLKDEGAGCGDAPHPVGPLGKDGAFMPLPLDRLRLPLRGRQLARHQP
jgi:hypothetical protein